MPAVTWRRHVQEAGFQSELVADTEKSPFDGPQFPFLVEWLRATARYGMGP